MLRSLRMKFVAVCMALMTALLAVVVYTAFLSARQNIERISSGVLNRVIREKQSVRRGPGIGEGEVVLPYFTVDIWNETAYITGGTYSALEDTELLSAILADCLEHSESEGTLPAYGLRYLRQDNGWYVRAAFVDMSMEIATLREMFASWLLISLVALPLLLGMSVLLSRRVVSPVEKAWEQQRRFLSDASHELKTPLTVILSNAELLESAPLEERPRRWAENIRSESRRMKALVEEMLVLARADNAVPSAAFGEVSFSDVAADCALSFEPVAFEAGKPLQYEIAPGVSVTGDREKLYRLTAVLLDNAVKYGAEGETITLTLSKTDRQARLAVSNMGNPLPPETLSRLFERFYRADTSRGEQSGFGLGLSIAAAIAKEHRGTLRAESDAESTRFFYAMPLKRRDLT